MSQNKAIQMAKEVHGMITEEHFKVVDIETPVCPDNGVLLKALSISPDPYMRGRLPGVDQTLANFSIGTVIESKNDAYVVGDVLTGIMPLQLVVPLSDFSGISKVQLDEGVKPSLYLSSLGMPGMTAFGVMAGFAGVTPLPGDVCLVSGAAGCVGSFVIQYLKHLGAKKVIGIAGGAEKCRLVVEEYGADECIDYKLHSTKESALAALKAAAPEGIDYFYENVGGVFQQAYFDHLAYNSRMAVCGTISNYNDTTPEMVENFMFKLIYKSATVKGIIVFDWATKPEFLKRFYTEVPALIKEGKMKTPETVINGFDQYPKAFVGLFTGINVGKIVVDI